MDAGSNIGVGSYSENSLDYTASSLFSGIIALDEMIRDLAKMGFITSFCTADYRCGANR